MKTESTKYLAIIPTQYASQHRTEQGAIRALQGAQSRLGLAGQVIAQYGSGYGYHSTQVVYPALGTLYTR